MISDLLAFIFLIGGMQGLMLTVALVKMPNRPPALIYLITLIGLVSFDLLGQLIFWQALYREWPHLLGVFSFLPASYGPIFYLYVKSLLRPGSHWSYKNLWMFTPISLAYLVNAPIYFLDGAEKIAMIDNIPTQGMPFTILIGSIIQLSSFFFVLAAIVRLWRDRHVGIRSSWLDWVLTMAVFQVIIWSLVILNLFVPVLAINGAPYLMVSVMLYVLGYKSLFSARAKVSHVTTSASVNVSVNNTEIQPEEKTSQEKYGNQRLDENTMEQLWQELETILLQDRLYTQPNLKVADLASRSGLASHMVSQVINATQNRNFNELINDMRIKEACRLLDQPTQLSIQAVMETAGFQAKSTFNTLFKQATGKTPSQYRKTN